VISRTSGKIKFGKLAMNKKTSDGIEDDRKSILLSESANKG
jgi:hypothetical protein